MRFDRYCPFTKFSSLFKRKHKPTHIVLSRILYKFPSKARVSFLFQASFEKLESETIQVDAYCPFRKIWLTFIKNTYGAFVYFSNISSTFWLRDNRVWSILSFPGSYILSFHGSKTNFYLKLKYFLVFKSSLKTLSGTIGFDPYCPFKDLIEISIKARILFVIQTFIKKLHMLHCGLSHIDLPKTL